MKWKDILKINRQKEMPFSGRLLGSLLDPTVNIQFFTESQAEFLTIQHQALIVRADDEFYDRLGMGKNERGGIDFGISEIIGQFVQNQQELNQFIEEHGDYVALINLRGSRLEFYRRPNPMATMGFVEIPHALYHVDNLQIHNLGIYDLPPPTLISGSEILYQDFIDIYEQLEADL
jgi:hypothetical protein